MLLQLGHNGPDVFDGLFRFATEGEIVGANEQADGAGIQVEHVLLQAVAHAAGGVAADATIRDLVAGEILGERAPALRDAVPEEHHGAAILRGGLGEFHAALHP